MTTLFFLYCGTIVTGGIAAYASRDRRPLIASIAVGFVFYDSAMLVVGSFGVPSQYFAIGLLGLTLMKDSWRGGFHGKHVKTLAALWLLSAFATAFGPFLFAGADVFASGVGLDEQINAQSQLQYTVSNVAQLSYLALNLTLVSILVKAAGAAHLVVDVILRVGTLLVGASLAMRAAGGSWPHEFFDNNPRNFYAIEDERLRAHLAEPSHLALFALTACAYFVMRSGRSRTLGSKIGHLSMAALAGVSIVYSSTGTGVIGAAVAAAGIGAYALVRFLRNPRLGAGAFLAALAAAAALVLLFDDIWAFGTEIISEKQGSNSLTNRSFADAHALRLALDTWGLGVGLGSNRSSSLVAMLISTVGVLGTIVFVRLCYWALSCALRTGQWHLAAGFFALMSGLAISNADLTNPVMWCLIAAGLCSSAASALPAQSATASDDAAADRKATETGLRLNSS